MHMHGEHDHEHGHEHGHGTNPLLTVARLDTMVTVVDAFTFFDRLSELARVKDQQDADGTEDENRTLADLMVQQVEFANVLLLNKTDLLLDSGPSGAGARELEA